MAGRIEVFKQMKVLEPDNPMILFGLANEYMKAERYTEAIGEFEAYLKYETDEGAAYGMLAKAFEACGQAQKARASYEKGIEVSLSHGHPSMAEDYRLTLESEYPD